MKKRCLLLILILFFMMPSAFALDLCTGKKFTDLKAKAYSSQLSWELKFDESGNHYFDIYLYNLDEEIVLLFDSIIYKKTNDNKILVATHVSAGETYFFELKPLPGSACSGEELYKKELKIPKYNLYSERKECIEYEEFPLCNKWYQGEIKDLGFFIEKLEFYKDSLAKKNIVEEYKNPNFIQRLIGIYLENLVVSIFLSILFIGVLVYFVLKKIISNRNKIKIDIIE